MPELCMDLKVKKKSFSFVRNQTLAIYLIISHFTESAIQALPMTTGGNLI
jgi:hypothetical protein